MDVHGHECTHVHVEVIARANGIACLCMRVGVNLSVRVYKSESNGVENKCKYEVWVGV